MGVAFAVFTSDPNLVRCELHRLVGEVSLGLDDHPNAVGVGSYAGEDVLLQRVQPETLPSIDALGPPQESEAVVFHSTRLPLGMSLEENTQPFRYRRWLFAHVGAVNAFAEIRGRLRNTLPEYLQRQLRGETDSEAAFMTLLRLLRDSGRTDDSRLEATTLATLLGKTAKILDQLAAEAGATRSSRLNFIATNGQILGACRHGDEPLYYALLEGTDRCEVCGLTASTARTEPLLRAHLKKRTVVVASKLDRPDKRWIELEPGHALAVGPDLSVKNVAF